MILETKRVTYNDRKEITEWIRKNSRCYRIHAISFCDSTESMTIELSRVQADYLTKGLFSRFSGIHVFVERDTFRYAHLCISFDEKVRIRKESPPIYVFDFLCFTTEFLITKYSNVKLTEAVRIWRDTCKFWQSNADQNISITKEDLQKYIDESM